MIRLTKKVDYGILLLAYIASRPGRAVTAKEIAADLHLSRPFAANVLKKLAREELLISTRGSSGGYTLARPPLSITLGDLVQALEGEFALAQCTSEAAVRHSASECHLFECCSAKGPVQYVHRRIAQVLSEVSFAELAGLTATAYEAFGMQSTAGRCP
ncbi:MAG: Rrf2 family transcriptional regulator [Planctomycetes bacterium]|nr:Rrf2 family transcriptional regulator [Planctomycetota bacterium]